MNPLPVLIFHFDQARHMFDLREHADYSHIILVPTGGYDDENPYERLYLVKATGLLKLFGIHVHNSNSFKGTFYGLVKHEGQEYRMFLA
jgi:hypothetical protein